MKHATPAALQTIEPLLGRLRAVEGLTEKSPGTFYRRSRAFLHFHEDPTGMYADVRLHEEADFERLRVTTAVEQDTLVREVLAALG
jgi:hypothetical protein